MDGKKRNDALKAEWTKGVKSWEVERNRAKCERQKLRWTKPKAPVMEKVIVKPRIADFEEESKGNEEMEVN
jgi:hypothetical protein